MRHAALGMLFACAASAHAVDANTVQVGRIIEMENGDRACYLRLEDDSGVPFNAEVGFDVCEEQARYAGKRVRLRYGMGMAFAESCGGNPDCKDIVRVPLVRSVEILPSKKSTGSERRSK